MADIFRRQTPARQLRHNRQFSSEMQWHRLPIEREGKVPGHSKHARRITRIPQQPALLRMVQQNNQGMTGDLATFPPLQNMLLGGQTVTSIEHIISDYWHIIA